MFLISCTEQTIIGRDYAALGKQLTEASSAALSAHLSVQ